MENFHDLFKLGQIIFVDLVLAGDNAIVIGLVAAKFSLEHRRKVIFYGVAAAVLLRIIFAVLTVQLLAIKGLVLAGGILLLWICWKLWVDLRRQSGDAAAGEADHPDSPAQKAMAQIAQPAAVTATAGNTAAANPPMLSSIMQIVVADLSMSLDNVLAVAGIADGHTGLLVIGLAISVAFMTFSAALIAGILQKHNWVGYIGLAVIIYVALRMMRDGALQLM